MNKITSQTSPVLKTGEVHNELPIIKEKKQHLLQNISHAHFCSVQSPDALPYFTRRTKVYRIHETGFRCHRTDHCSGGEGLIIHGELRIGDCVIMFADATEDFTALPAGLFIYVDNVNETYRKALEQGAISKMEPASPMAIPAVSGTIWK